MFFKSAFEQVRFWCGQSCSLLALRACEPGRTRCKAHQHASNRGAEDPLEFRQGHSVIVQTAEAWEHASVRLAKERGSAMTMEGVRVSEASRAAADNRGPPCLRGHCRLARRPTPSP